jgi:hypothetical protein
MADKNVVISQSVLQMDLLRSQVFALGQTNAQLQREIGQLRADNQEFQDQIARLKRTSSKPPSSDIVKPPKKKPPRGRHPRKIGGQKGHLRQERVSFRPEDIGPVKHYELSPEQAQGLIPLDDWCILQQVDLVEKPYVVTEAGFARSMDRIRRGFLQAVRRPPWRAEAQTSANRVRGREADSYVHFLTMPGIEPTNNQTEQAIRHIVLSRPITQGARGSRGQRWCERVWTVLATCRQQKRRVFDFFCNALHARFRHETAPALLR